MFFGNEIISHQLRPQLHLYNRHGLSFSRQYTHNLRLSSSGPCGSSSSASPVTYSSYAQSPHWCHSTKSSFTRVIPRKLRDTTVTNPTTIYESSKEFGAVLPRERLHCETNCSTNSSSWAGQSTSMLACWKHCGRGRGTVQGGRRMDNGSYKKQVIVIDI